MEVVLSLGMGLRNKILLRFKLGDIFWPERFPELCILYPRFQFFDLDFYGKGGVLLEHMFAKSLFVAGYWDLHHEELFTGFDGSRGYFLGSIL